MNRTPSIPRARSRVEATPPTQAYAIRQAHLRVALTVLACLVPAAGLLGTLTIPVQLAVVALPIATLGVMHGAVDPWVAEIMQRRHFGRRGRAAFVTAYAAVACAVIAAWVLAPVPTLAAFLAVSVLHFGEQDARAFGRRRDPLAVLVYGAIPVLAPIAGHPDDVGVVFGWLIGVDPAVLRESLVWLVQPLAAIWLVGAGMLVSRMIIEREPDLPFKLFGLGVVLAAMLVLPPLIAFAAYFCLLHSFGHLFDLAVHEAGPWRDWSLSQWTARLWPATLATLALGLSGWLLLAGLVPDALPWRERLAQFVFCGLAALTVPHVVLHECFHRVRRS